MEDLNMEAKEWEGDFDPLSDPDEKRHLLSVLDSFRYLSQNEFSRSSAEL